MTLSFFSDVFVINQISRVDRAREVSEELRKIGCDRFTLFKAVEPADVSGPGVIPDRRLRRMCCTLSHLSVLKQAKERGLESVLIFEDDAVFEDDFLEHLPATLSFLNSTPWDMFYFGINHVNPPLNTSIENIKKVTHGYTLHAYAIHSRFLDYAINLITYGSSTADQKGKVPFSKMLNHDPIDVLYARVHHNHAIYSSFPRLVYQRDGYSGIEGTMVAYSNGLRDTRKKP